MYRLDDCWTSCKLHDIYTFLCVAVKQVRPFVWCLMQLNRLDNLTINCLMQLWGQCSRNVRCELTSCERTAHKRTTTKQTNNTPLLPTPLQLSISNNTLMSTLLRQLPYHILIHIIDYSHTLHVAVPNPKKIPLACFGRFRRDSTRKAMLIFRNIRIRK
jgi:hypothetical protein